MNPNAKGDLIAELLASGLGAPLFEVHASGPAHEQTFVVSVSAAGRLLGQGEGRTKKEAERAAAEDALQQLSIHEPPEPHATIVPVAGEAGRWPIYSAVLAEALTVALDLAPEDARPEDVRREAALLYRELLSELGHGPE